MSPATSADRVQRDDVDDVIGLATEMMHADRDALTAADLQAVGAELDVPPEYVERARAELERRRALSRREKDAEVARRRRTLRGAAFAGGALVVVLALWSSVALSSLRTRHAAVMAQAAQVENVRARRESVDRLLEGRPASPDVDAERIGAENRIRVETQRYAEAAAAYNAAASSFPASWVGPLAGLPAQLPLVP